MWTGRDGSLVSCIHREGRRQTCLTLLAPDTVQYTQEALIINEYMLFTKRRTLSNDVIGDFPVKEAFIV